jgi:hypothetical protein
VSTKAGPTRRLNLKLTAEVSDRLENLQQATGAASLTEVIARSLAVYEALWSAKDEGSTITITPQGGDPRDLWLI